MDPELIGDLTWTAFGTVLSPDEAEPVRSPARRRDFERNMTSIA
jgi:hypothetical protein